LVELHQPFVPLYEVFNLPLDPMVSDDELTKLLLDKDPFIVRLVTSIEALVPVMFKLPLPLIVIVGIAVIDLFEIFNVPELPIMIAPDPDPLMLAVETETFEWFIVTVIVIDPRGGESVEFCQAPLTNLDHVEDEVQLLPALVW
jgi:hypothetical protein